MRILHVLDHSAPLQSGYTFRTLSILREQRRLGWETAQVTSSKHRATALEEDAEGMHFYRTLPTAAAWAKLPVLRQVAVIRSLARRLEELVDVVGPDILHAHSPALNGVAVCRVGAARGIPVVYEMRALWEDAAVDHGTSRDGGVRYRVTRALESYVLRRADAVTTICNGLRDEIVARGIPESDVTVIPNAVDVERFSAERRRDGELARALGLDGAEVVGFIGSFYAYEGLGLLLSAMATLAPYRPNLRLLLVGGGPQDQNLRQKAVALGLGDKVVFTGRVPFDDVGRHYDLVDVLAYPRLHMRLTDLVTPLKPLEAMAMGKPLVASDVGGHVELIEDGETGWLFGAGDASELAAKLAHALDLDDRGRSVGAAARRFVERERTWAKSVARYRDVYARVLEGAARG
jgi:PEP-CTERM/exosortase A-associated glycosyltransferase